MKDLRTESISWNNIYHGLINLFYLFIIINTFMHCMNVLLLQAFTHALDNKWLQNRLENFSIILQRHNMATGLATSMNRRAYK